MIQSNSPRQPRVRPRIRFTVWVLATLLVWGPCLWAQSNHRPADQVEFNRDVRPILADRCFACHGPDANKREADLRLDTRAGLLGDGDSTGVATPGDPEDSELLRRIVADDPTERMPPASSHKSVSADEAQLIRRWIDQGAEWQGHWSLEKIRRPEVPKSALAAPIDAFIEAKLTKLGRQPAPSADPRILFRRLHLDLLGLPPDPQTVERFVVEYQQDPNAYERWVDTLLASPHFGERMAMWWLDLVRYADSVGYHGDQAISVSPYRDYVIKSFQANKPFDQFTREQLAGDLMGDVAIEVAIASGYNRLGMMSAEGGVQDKEYLAKYIAERVRNLGGTWLGTTLGCCECHDHKFDPITQREFYALEAFFADIEEQGLYSGANDSGVWGPHIEVPTPEQDAERKQLNEQIAVVQQRLSGDSPELDRERQAWTASLVPWHSLQPDRVTSAQGATLQIKDDFSILASGESPPTDKYVVEFSSIPAGTTAIRLEVLPDETLPAKGPGRADNGNFVLSELLCWIVSPNESGESSIERQVFASATATFEQPDPSAEHPWGKFAIESAIDDDQKAADWGWAIAGQPGQMQRAVFMLATPINLSQGQRLRVELRQNFARNPRHTLGRFRLDATTQTGAVTALSQPPREIELLALQAPDAQSDEQRNLLEKHFRSMAETLAPFRAELEELKTKLKKLTAEITTTPVTKNREPRTIRVLARGNWMDETGEVVVPATPSALAGPALPSDRRLSRLDLANWVVSSENPLTARVYVNRIWKLLFGAGLSVGLGDLGAQGDWPSHPELLDWLAIEFMDSGWDSKRLIKTIVMSEAYRRSSAASAAELEWDPTNRWLSRQGRWRLDAEMVRDAVLCVSGMLDRRIGGRSVKPYQPPGYWAYLNFPQREWDTGAPPDIYRRGLYTHWQRQYLHPSLAAFDAPCREECTVDRPRSNTPLQALALLNDPSYVEAARALALRIIRESSGDDAAKIDWAVSQVLGRAANQQEAEVLLTLLQKHRAAFAADEEAARKLLRVGPLAQADDVLPAEWSAWTSVSRALLNLHEFITRE